MAWMYIVQCRDGSFYTGSTTLEPEQRVWLHNNDDDWAAAYTRSRRPVLLVFAEEFERVEDAFAREKQVQGWGRSKKAALIAGRYTDLPGLSASHVARDAHGSGS